MAEWQLGVIEARFADLVWANAPISSPALCALCEKELSWKKSTTYTVLKRLCDKGLFRNVKGTVSTCLSREEFYARQSEQYVDRAFGGSLPAFLAAFTTRKSLSTEEIDELRRLLDAFEEA